MTTTDKTVRAINRDTMVSVGLVLGLGALVWTTSSSFSRIETLVGTIGTDVAGVQKTLARIDLEATNGRVSMARELADIHAEITVLRGKVDNHHP